MNRTQGSGHEYIVERSQQRIKRHTRTAQKKKESRTQCVGLSFIKTFDQPANHLER